MSRSDDSWGDMSRFPSSLEAERLLSGRISPDDLPDEAARLARLLQGMEPGAANDPFTEQRIVSDMTAEILRNPAPETTPSPLRSSGSRVSAKAGALALVAVLATGTAAAAANGSLPAGMQRAVSDALSHVSISVPRPAPHRPQPVEPHNGGTDGSFNGGSPGGQTGPVGPRGVDTGKDDDETPRGPTNATPGSKAPEKGSNGKGNDGNHSGPPSSVPNGPKTTNPGGANPNKGPGNNSGQNAGANPNKGPGNNSGQNAGANPNKGPGSNSGQGKKKGQETDPSTVTTTTVKTNNGKRKGAENGNAGGTSNANSSAKQKVSGTDEGP